MRQSVIGTGRDGESSALKNQKPAEAGFFWPVRVLASAIRGGGPIILILSASCASE